MFGELTFTWSPLEVPVSMVGCVSQDSAGDFLMRIVDGEHIDGSRLFVYKATRNLMGVTGDYGAWLRSAMGALALCGWQFLLGGVPLTIAAVVLANVAAVTG